MKRCKKCGKVKPLADFYNEKSGRDGKRPACKLCESTARRRWTRRTAEEPSRAR